jgi:hypothetical protein
MQESDEQADYEWRMSQFLSSQAWTCRRCYATVPALLAGVHMMMECSMGPLFNPDSDSRPNARGAVRDQVND